MVEIEESDKKEDELSIDFGKIFSFFKKKKPESGAEHHETHQQHTEHQSHEPHHAAHPAKEEGEELSFDFGSIAGFFKRNYVWFLVLIPLILAVYFRMASASLPMTDDWATNNIHNFIKQDISNLISQSYPNLPAANKNKLIEDEFAKALKEGSYAIKTGQYTGQTINIANEIKGSSQTLKQFWQYELNGKQFVYMPDIDPYTYLRYARNYLETGQLGDEVKNGVQWDNHMTAPIGSPVDKKIHPYVLAWMHKVISIFKPSYDLMQSANLFPIIFSALAVIPAFFIGRKLAGNVGGLFAAVMVAINPAFLARTTWGHADTDAYNVMFPLFIAWFFLEALETKTLWKKIGLASLAGLATGLFSYAWGGWWYVFDFLLIAAGVYFVYLLVAHRRDIKKILPDLKSILMILIIFVVVTGIFTTLFVGFDKFMRAPFGPLSFTSIKVAAKDSLWPNVYMTVAEMNAASFGQIVGSVGGKLLFIVALAGIALMLLKKDKDGKIDLKYFALLSVWFLATIYASTKGIRFTLLLVPAFSLAFGTAFGKIYEYANKWGEKGLHLSKKIIAPVVILVFILLLLGPAKAWYKSTTNDIPIVNDAWWSTLTKINQESKPDAIINSWWDFGHHFKYIADRAVTFDGASQNKPMAHWIGKVLLTSDEKEAVGILRMLDCGSNNAFNELDKKIDDVSKSVKLLYDIVKLDKEEAENLLKDNGLTSDEAENVLRYTHCSPPEDYFITSDDMIGKAGVWGHFGSWNFDRADMWLTRNEPKSDFVKDAMKNNNFSKEEAESLYEELQSITDEQEGNSWIAPWPNYASGIVDCAKQGDAMQCGAITIDSKANNVTIQTQQGTVKPASFVYFDGKNVVEKEFEGGAGDISVAMMPVQNGYNAILMQKPIAMSMFNRLYLFMGQGLSCFKPFDSQRQLTGGMVYTWKIDWDCKKKNEVFLEENKTQETPKIAEEAATTTETIAEEPTVTNSSENVSGVLIE